MRLTVHFDTPNCVLVRERRRGEGIAASSKPFVAGRPHTIKVQVPMSPNRVASGSSGSSDGLGGLSLLCYTRVADRIFEIRGSANDSGPFSEVVQAVRERGLQGGLKGYFNAWAAGDFNPADKTQVLDIDARCMKPAQAF